MVVQASSKQKSIEVKLADCYLSLHDIFMYRWTIEANDLDLKYTWKIARAEISKKTIYTVKITNGVGFAIGEVAGISQKDLENGKIVNSFQDFAQAGCNDIDKIIHFHLPAQLNFGADSAFVHLLAQKNQKTVAQYFGKPEVKKVETSFSLPIMPVPEISSFFANHNLGRFKVLKMKIGFQDQLESVKELHNCFKGPIRVDANEAFSDHQQVVDFANKLQGLPIQFLEQPMPSTHKEEYKKLKQKINLPVFADESLQNEDIPADFAQMFDGVNIKLMKAGSYGQALRQIEQAQSMGLKTMLGCMVETSLGINSALNIAHGVDYFDLDSFLFFKQDPYGLVQESNGILSRV